MSRVFVSHAGPDRELAAQVHRWLVDDGHEVFLDQDLRDGITVGDEWEQRLHERLRWADALVCVVTSSYLSSVWCTAEVGIARTRGSRVLPILAEPGVQHPLLTALQQTDMTHDLSIARAALLEALRRVDAVAGLGWPDDRSPYPGLRPFDTDMARVFFGRSREVQQILERLRSPAELAESSSLLLVLGPSGAGKSSLVRAGIVPAMAAEPGWLTLSPIVPGRAPLAALTRLLAQAGNDHGLRWTTNEVRDRLDSGFVDLADELLLAAPRGQRRRLLLVVDQLEQLVTQSPPDEAVRFIALFREAAAGPIQTLATLRPEFVDRVFGQPGLGPAEVQPHLVLPLTRGALRTVIEEPARVAGLVVSADMVARLIADTERGDALPLLAFTLAELARGTRRGDELSIERYEQLGGVGGAIIRGADGALVEALAAAGRDLPSVMSSLLRVVTIDDQGSPSGYPVDRAELAEPVVAELDAFVNRRLLTISAQEDGRTTVNVAHEAFLTAWTPLRDAIAESVLALKARRGVEQAAQDWDLSGRPPNRLWERGRLSAALADTGARLLRPSQQDQRNLDEPGHTASRRRLVPPRRVLQVERTDLSSNARTFLAESIRRDQRRRRRATTVLSVLLAAAVTAAVLATVQRGNAQRERDRAQDRQLAATAAQLSAQAAGAEKSDPRTALRLAIAATVIHPDADTRAQLARSVLGSQYVGTLGGMRGEVVAGAVGAHGKLLATTDETGQVTLWSVSSPQSIRRAGRLSPGDGVSLGQGGVAAIAFSPDGGKLASSQVKDQFDASGQLKSSLSVGIWDVQDPTRPARLGAVLPVANDRNAINAAVSDIVFSPDGNTVAISTGLTLNVWEVSDPSHPRRIVGPRSGPFDLVAFTPNGDLLVGLSTRQGGQARSRLFIWHLTRTSGPQQIGAGIAYRDGARFNATNGLVALPTLGTVGLWTITDRARPREVVQLASPSGTVGQVWFASDGRSLAMTGRGITESRTLRVWDLTDPSRPRPFGGRAGPATRGGVGEGSAAVLVTSQPVRSVSFLQGRPLLSAVTGPDTPLAALGETITTWDFTDPAFPTSVGPAIQGPTGGLHSVSFLPDGSAALTGRADGSILVWNLADPGAPRRIATGPSSQGETAIASVQFLPGHILALAGTNGSVSWWNVADPTSPVELGAGLPSGQPASESTVAFSRDGRLVAVSDPDGVTLWDATTRARLATLTGPFLLHPEEAVPQSNVVQSMAFTPDSRTLVVLAFATQTAISVWDVSNPARGRAIGQPVSPPATPRLQGVTTSGTGFLAAFADGRTVAYSGPNIPGVVTATLDKSLGLGQQSVTAGHKDQLLTGTFSADGTLLATGSADWTVTLWDFRHLTPQSIGLPLTGHEAGVETTAFSPDRRILATGDSAGRVILWDLADPRQPHPLGQSLGGVPSLHGPDTLTSVAFSADGQTLATATDQGLTLWDLTDLVDLRAHAVSRACAEAGGGLTRAEWAIFVDGLPYQQTCPA